MSVITAITPQVKNVDRCNIYVDNTFYCGMQLETVIKNKLKVGITIDKQELCLMQLESEKSVALNKAMGFISNSMKTSKAVKDYLATKGYTQPVCQYVIDKLLEYGFVNDSEYAKAYVRSYSKNRGAKLIKMQLRAKGVSDSDMAEALESIDNELESATAVAEKYLKNKQIDNKNMQKAYKYLLSKGFSYETASSVIKGIYKECEEF